MGGRDSGEGEGMGGRARGRGSWRVGTLRYVRCLSVEMVSGQFR